MGSSRGRAVDGGGIRGLLVSQLDDKEERGVKETLIPKTET